eukprot:113697_1
MMRMPAFLDAFPAFVDYINTFDFKDAPLSSWHAPAFAVCCYLFMIVVCKQIAKALKTPLKLNMFAAIHSGFLSLASLALLLSMVKELSANYVKTGSFYTVLYDPAYQWATGRLTFLYYVNYLFKYYELIDTMLLALKGKPIIFLHWFHHAATLVLTWVFLTQYAGMQWVIIVMNLNVHVVMYAYYCLSALRVNCWWKRYITAFQIAQFVVDFVMVWTAVLIKFVQECREVGEDTWMPTPSGTYESSIFAGCLLTSYLVLFMMFYSNAYSGKAKNAGKCQVKVVGNAVSVSGLRTADADLRSHKRDIRRRRTRA